MRKIIWFTVIAVLVLALFSALLVLNRTTKTMSKVEQEAALAKMLGHKPNLKDAPSGYLQYQGRYASFMYPASATIYKSVQPAFKNSGNYLDSFSFDMYDPRLILNFSVVKTIVQDVSDVADVRLRQEKEQGYGQSEISSDGQKGLAFVRQGDLQSEKSGFFIINSKLYTVSVAGSSLPDVVNLFNSIIRSLTFKN